MTSTLGNLLSLCERRVWLQGGIKLGLNRNPDPSPHAPETLMVSAPQNKIQALGLCLSFFSPQAPVQSQKSFISRKRKLAEKGQ